jgi:uncharacterized protein involved in exopolysaccharide biosynthesis
MTGVIAESRWFRDAWRRRAIVAVVLILLLIISVFPRTYRAAMVLAPTDPNSLGLSGPLSQLGAFTSVFGSQAALEISLKVARSAPVRAMVAQRIDLIKTHHLEDEPAADRWLQSHVNIRALRGGLIQIDTLRSSPKEALQIVSAYGDVLRERLAQINRLQTAYKRKMITDLVETSGERYYRAQAAYDTFRRQTGYTTPGQTIEGIGNRVPLIEQQLKDLQVQLETARAFNTNDSFRIHQIEVQIAATRRQLAEAQARGGDNPYSVNTVIGRQQQLEKLDRELNLTYGLYVNYRRFLEGTAVEDLAATANMRVLETPYIDSSRQIRTLPMTLAILVFLAALAVELYLSRPPVSAVRSEA